MIYFIQVGDGGSIKIGESNNVENRLVKMQSDNLDELRIVATYEGVRTENELHKMFSDYRIRGEWFKPSDLLISFINNHADKYKRNKRLGRGRPSFFNQNIIAKNVNISDSMLSQILSGKRRPSWKLAKRLAFETKTLPELWLDGTPEQIKEKLAANNL